MGKRLKWCLEPEYELPHFRADTEFGEYLIGQRKGDKFWEYCTPDEGWGEHDAHEVDNLTKGRAFGAAEMHYQKLVYQSDHGLKDLNFDLDARWDFKNKCYVYTKRNSNEQTWLYKTYSWRSTYACYSKGRAVIEYGDT